MQFAVLPADVVGVSLDIAGIQQILFDLIRSGGDSAGDSELRAPLDLRQRQRERGPSVSFSLFPSESEWGPCCNFICDFWSVVAAARRSIWNFRGLAKLMQNEVLLAVSRSLDRKEGIASSSGDNLCRE